MAPLFEHYGVQLWLPEADGRVNFASEHDEQTTAVLGLSSKREVVRTSIRVQTAMAVQTRDQGRYLGGRAVRAPADSAPQDAVPALARWLLGLGVVATLADTVAHRLGQA
jgi:hypothetical protein